MDNGASNVEISVNELKLLVNALSKSVALSLKKRPAWLWLLAGLLIGVGITLLIIGLAWKRTDKISVTPGPLLERTEVVISDLQQIRSSVEKLTLAVDALNEKTQTDIKPFRPPDEKSAEINRTQHIIHHGKYRVYLHYSDIKNKNLIEKLSVFLEENGFKVSGIQKVDYQNRDIRFFNDQDKEGAFLVKQHLSRFIKSFTDLKEKNIKIINLNRKYPDARKGTLEVWVDF